MRAILKEKLLIVSEEEVLSIMINEEDHLRIQVMQSGFNLDETWKLLPTRLMMHFHKNLDYAYSLHWGYLTACPTNTGTAMRGSVMLHLPALVMTKQINKVLAAISKLSFASQAGFMEREHRQVEIFIKYRIRLSMGHSEQDVLQNINGLIRQVIEQEEQARQALLGAKSNDGGG